MPATSSGKATFSITVRQGNVDSSWNTMPMSLCEPSIGLPSTKHAAAVGRLEPADDVEERGLAAARGADHGDELALAHLDARFRQRLDRPALGHERFATPSTCKIAALIVRPP